MQDTITLYDVFMPPAGTTITTTRLMTKKERKDVAKKKLAELTIDILREAALYDGIKSITVCKNNKQTLILVILDDALVVKSSLRYSNHNIKDQIYPFKNELSEAMTAYKWLLRTNDPCFMLKIIKMVTRNINNKKAVNGMKREEVASVKCCKTCGTRLSDAL
jgi:hypothetical protein